MTSAVSFGILPQDRGTRCLFSIKQKRESQKTSSSEHSNDFELQKDPRFGQLIASSPSL